MLDPQGFVGLQDLSAVGACSCSCLCNGGAGGGGGGGGGTVAPEQPAQ